jgi:DNA repair protein RadC
VVTPLLAGRDREHGLLLALDTKYRLIDVEQVSIGTADHTFLAPREVYRDALLYGATAIAVAHNHPSGDPKPSVEDVGITERLARAGITLGVELIDHLVIGSDGEWTSLAREGLV